MTRYIDDEDFPEGFFEKQRRQATEEKGFDEKTCIPVTIHYAEPVRHGKWREYPSADGLNQCSECGVLRFGESNYCPNCGARMDEERKEE